MKIQDLEQNDIVKTLVNNIIADKTFKSKCEMNFKQIFDDGKVDKDDIPIIINLVLTIYNNHNKIKVSKKNMKPVFMLLISKLLVEFKGDIMIDESLILLMLEPQIDILLMSVATIGKIKCPWCASRPSQDAEDNVYHKMKINKIDKERIVKQSVDVIDAVDVEEVLPRIEEETTEGSNVEEEKVDLMP